MEFRLPNHSMAFQIALPERRLDMFDPRLEHPAAVSRSQAPGNPFGEACNLPKNRRVSAAQVAYYHGLVGLQHLFSHFIFT
jgi:hypothetical protein